MSHKLATGIFAVIAEGDLHSGNVGKIVQLVRHAPDMDGNAAWVVECAELIQSTTGVLTHSQRIAEYRLLPINLEPVIAKLARDVQRDTLSQLNALTANLLAQAQAQA